MVCDAVLLRSALEKGQLEEARALYRGRFLEGADHGLGEELEEWVWSTREALAESLFQAHREVAERLWALGLPEEASALMRAVLDLPGVREALVEPEERLKPVAPLPEGARRTFYAVAFLGPARAGELLGLDPEDLDQLWRRGLLDAQGRPTLTPPLTLEARKVALELARRLPPAEAAPFYQLALPFWEAEDRHRGEKALLKAAQARVEGDPKEALMLLEALAPTPEVLLLKRGLERLGRYGEARETLAEIPESPEKKRPPRGSLLPPWGAGGSSPGGGEGPLWWSLRPSRGVEPPRPPPHGRGAFSGSRGGLQPSSGALPPGRGGDPPSGGLE